MMNTNGFGIWYWPAVLGALLAAAACNPDTPPDDAGTDAAVAMDAGDDAGATDAGADAGSDAGVDAGTDAGTDAGLPRGRPYRLHPPSIPHDAFGCGITCLACHETGAGTAPMTSHPERRMCTQCHLPANEDIPPFVDSTFFP